MLQLIRFSLTLIYAISLIYVLLDCDVNNRKNLYIVILLTSIMSISTGYILITFGYIAFMKVYPFLVHVPSFILFLWLSKVKGVRLLFVILTVFVLCVPPIAVGLLVSSFFSFNLSISNILIIILYIPTWFMVYKYLRPLFIYMLQNTNKGWFGFSIIPLSYYTLIYFIIINDASNDRELHKLVIIIIGLILTLASYVLILQFFKQTQQQLVLESNHNLLKIQIEASKSHLIALKNSQENTIIHRHDMRHQLNLINAYLAEGNIQAAQKYIQEIEETIQDSAIENYCSNYSVNLILSSYLEKAKKKGITIETQINIPEIETVKDMDLCIVFSNAIENAINASALIPNPDLRSLKVISKVKNNKIFIELTNNYIGPITFVDDIPNNTEDGHGLGLKSIIAIVEKYDGIYSFKTDKGIFKLRIII